MRGVGVVCCGRLPGGLNKCGGQEAGLEFVKTPHASATNLTSPVTREVIPDLPPKHASPIPRCIVPKPFILMSAGMTNALPQQPNPVAAYLQVVLGGSQELGAAVVGGVAAPVLGDLGVFPARTGPRALDRLPVSCTLRDSPTPAKPRKTPSTPSVRYLICCRLTEARPVDCCLIWACQRPCRLRNATTRAMAAL